MKSTTTLLAAAGLFAINAQAGTPVVPMDTATEVSIASESGLLGTVGGELSAGYDSSYIFRGANLGDDAIWTGLDLSIPLAEGVSLDLGAWYINPTSGGAGDDELDLYAWINTSLGGIDVGLGYTAYTYPEIGRDAATNEIGVTLGKEIGCVAVGVGYYYDFDLELSYYEGSLGVSQDLAEGISVGLTATAGFVEEDYAHTTVVLELPIALSANATLTPYIAGVFPGDDVFGDSDDEVFGGASIGISF